MARQRAWPRRYLLATALACAVPSLPARGWAQPSPAKEPSAADKETAHAALDDGNAKLATNDIVGALKAFRAAYELVGYPTVGMEVVRAEVALGHLVEANAVARAVTRYPVSTNKLFEQAKAEAAALVEALEPRIPSLHLKIIGPSAEVVDVSIDGVSVPAAALAVPRKLDPGSHFLLVKAPGFVPETRQTSLVEGQAATLSIALHTIPAGTRTLAPFGGGGAPTWAWVTGGLGLASTGVGAGFLVASISGQNDINDNCSKAPPVPGYAPGDCQSKRNANNVRQVLAGAFGGAGLLSVLIAIVAIAKDPPRAAAGKAWLRVWPEPWIGLQLVGGSFAGRF